MKTKIIASVLFAVMLCGAASVSAQTTGDINPNPVSSSCVSITHNLLYRSSDISTGGDVSNLQYFLQSQGYLNSEPTGYFGLLTQNAVKAFQQANNITPVSGYVGPITRGKINASSCNRTTQTSPNPSTSTSPTATGVRGCLVGAPYNYLTGALCAATTTVDSVTITSPTSGSVLYPGVSYTLTWVGSRAGETAYNVYLIHGLNGPTSDLTRNLGTANASEHSFAFTIPTDVATGTNYQIQLGGTVVARTGYFTIGTQNSTCTKTGDVNCDGVISQLDYDALNRGYLSQSTANPLTGWQNGDLDGNGKINFDDYYILNQAFLHPTTSTQTPTIAVTSPSSGTVLSIGQTLAINWQSSNLSTININLYVGNVYQRNIANGVNASLGSYSWTVPSLEFGTSNLYQIVLSDAATNGVGTSARSGFISFNTTSASSAAISSITAAPVQPSITVLSPNGGETIQIGSTQMIRWNTSNFPIGSTVYLELRGHSANNFGIFSKIAVVSPTSGSYSWQIPSTLSSGEYVMEMYKADQSGSIDPNEYVKDVSNNFFTISAPACLSGSGPLAAGQSYCTTNTTTQTSSDIPVVTSAGVTIVAPATGASLQVGKTYTAYWTGTYTGAPTINVYLLSSSGSSTLLGTVLSSTNTTNFTIPSTLAAGSYRLQLGGTVIARSGVFSVVSVQ